MDPVETPAPIAAPKSRPWTDWLAGLFLFLATALVVVWQNSRLAVLWDLGYVLDNSYRISLGDVPYRDFPFAHAPLMFLIQAALIKLTGRVFWHHVAYCAAIGGLSTVLTWRILRNVMGNRVSHPRLQAFLLSLPLLSLGIYCVFPHPFYDSDCTLAILIAVLLLQRLISNHHLRRVHCLLVSRWSFHYSSSRTLDWHSLPARSYCSLRRRRLNACGIDKSADTSRSWPG